MRRAREKVFGIYAEGLPDLLPDGLFAGSGEREVDALQRHPVYEPLPFSPSPPGKGVAEGAVVEEEPVPYEGPGAHSAVNARHHGRQRDGVVGVPGNAHGAPVLEVPAQSRSHAYGTVTADFQSVANCPEGVGIDGVGNFPEANAVSGSDSSRKRPGGPFGRSGTGNGGRRCGEQDS